MSIKENIAALLRWYKEVNNLSMNEFAEELGIAVSSLQSYLNGTSNPRAETLELLADKLHVSLTEMVSGAAPEWKRAETVVRAASELSRLTPEKRQEGIRLFLELVKLFSV